MNSDYIRQLFDKQSGYGSRNDEKATSKSPPASTNTSSTLRRLFDNGGNISNPPNATLSAESIGDGPPEYDHSKISTQTPFRTILKVAARRHADSVAVKVPHQAKDRYPHLRNSMASSEASGLQWSYSMLHDAAGLLAAALYDRGARRGQAIAVFLTEGVELALFFWAAVRLGAVFVPYDPAQLAKFGLLGRRMSLLDGAAVVVGDESAARQWESEMLVMGAEFPLRIVAQDLAREQVGHDWYSLGVLLKIWNINANYILKSVDENAAREDWSSTLEKRYHPLCARDHVAMTSSGEKYESFDCFTTDMVMEKTSALIQKQDLTHESPVVVESVFTAEGFITMAAAFRAGASVTLSKESS